MLHDIDLAIYPGEVTALVGDNGAGKSTLVKCIAGINSIDSGTVLFEGKPVHLTDPRVAAALGIEFVYQDLALADNLDITQNMFLGREIRRFGFLADGLMERKATRHTSLQARLSRLSGDADDDNSPPNTDGLAESSTTDKSEAHKRGRAR